MNVAIRVDASIAIGSGHVMRCLTLADALKGEGADVVFICRPHVGNLIQKIRNKGYTVFELSPPTDQSDNSLFHAAWLGATQDTDAIETGQVLKDSIDWLIVDHYALDAYWQTQLRQKCAKILVIDDLGDRSHDCDVLLDQNFGSTSDKYKQLVPRDCTLLTGTDYALLRSEFFEWREYSLKRREQQKLKHLLVNLGGVDSGNVTTKILEALNGTDIQTLESVTVVMGSTAPNLEAVKKAAARCKYRVQVRVDVSNMAEVLANSDMAIGAAGATTWERCTLGLPTLLLVLAENQRNIAEMLQLKGVVYSLNSFSSFSADFELFCRDFRSLSEKSANLVDALGVSRVVSLMSDLYRTESGVVLVPYPALKVQESLFVLKMRNHDSIRVWMNNVDHISSDDHLHFVSSLTQDKTKKYFQIIKNNEVIGCINFVGICYRTLTAEFVIFANPYLQLKGKGTILISAAIEYAKAKLSLATINLEVNDVNKVALSLYKKFGFKVSSLKSNRVRMIKNLGEDE